MAVIFKRTKILATLGPITSTPDMIKDLIEAGVNGLRLNFSHGDYEAVSYTHLTLPTIYSV